MALPKIEDARRLNDQELDEQIVAVKRELFQLRFQKGTRRLEKTHLFKHNRHRLAQLMTVERERQLAVLTAVSTSESSAVAE
jgi:large subunit ribosomal protein L29